MPQRTLRLLPLVGLAALVLAGGCGGYTLNSQVEGTVKLDGTALPNVTVIFMPDDPKTQYPSSSGTTDDKGHFTLTCNNGKSGAVIGKHNVTVLVGRNEAGDTTTQRAVLPIVYTITEKTPLIKDVTAGEHTYNLDLSKTPPARPK